MAEGKTMNTQRIPAEVFPPGEFIREEIEERGWTHQVDPIIRTAVRLK